MNLVKTRAVLPELRDEEALVVENAVRLAVDSVLNVLYGLNSSRARELQRMVSDRDAEIQRLECRLREIEQELQLLRRQGGGGGGGGGGGSCHCSCSSRLHQEQQEERAGDRPEETGGGQECEMSISLGLFARPPSHVSCQSHESALPSSPSRVGPDQSCTSRSSESSGLSEVARNLPTSPSSLVVKEEPCDIDTVLIKWEMSEERIGAHQETAGNPCQDRQSPGIKNTLENRERRKFREKPHTDADGHCSTDGEHLRNNNKRKSVPMSELPEEAQRLKRAAWRAASRRYYARKIARQQAKPHSRSGPFSHTTDSRYPQPASLADQRRLVSEMPDESQSLQREAWKTASKGYYALKSTQHEAEPTQFIQLLPNSEQRQEETLSANRGGAHASSGGIMCS